MPSLSSVSVGRALVSLAIGGFAIGTTEFVTMGILPEIAHGVSVDIPTAGSIVSAYALGVVVGAPAIAMVGARVPRRVLLIGLMVAFAVFNAASAFAPNYGTLLAARFLAGLPHGAYFGIASVVASALVPPARRTWATSMVLAGLTVANIVGVPVATALGQRLGWGWPYGLVAVIALLAAAAVWCFVPEAGGSAEATIGSELSALRRPQVWLALLIGIVGFGGMFSTFSYITPTMTTLAGFSTAAIPWVLIVYGIGMTTGAFLAGPVSRVGLLRGIFLSLAAIAALLSVFGYAAHSRLTALPAVFLLGVLPSILVPMLQTRLMDVAHEGQALAAALNHSTLNIANAVGAWLGGLVLAGGLGYEWPSRVGAFLALAGIGVTLASAALGRHTARSAARLQTS
ncbi:MFS transporter [Metallococcus carri]|uniref:MFS transporter n=1 Tax=Metallococcus carri TaxID=1656884 RepID=UPI002E2A729F|nr:MFS transporter [Metallococcus carri]